MYAVELLLSKIKAWKVDSLVVISFIMFCVKSPAVTVVVAAESNHSLDFISKKLSLYKLSSKNGFGLWSTEKSKYSLYKTDKKLYNIGKNFFFGFCKKLGIVSRIFSNDNWVFEGKVNKSHNTRIVFSDLNRKYDEIDKDLHELLTSTAVFIGPE